MSELLYSQKISRSAHDVATAEQTTIFLGHCKTCDRPVRRDGSITGTGRPLRGDHCLITCYDCGSLCDAQRLYAVTNQLVCDGSCHGARGPICNCGCGGINHGRVWGFPLGTSTETVDALAKFREHQRKTAERREARETAKKVKAKNAFDNWAAENVQLIAGIIGANENYDDIYPLSDFAQMIRNHKILSDGQARYARVLVTKVAEREERKREQEKNARPCPTGKMTIRGQIVKAEIRDGMYGTEYKMTVKCDGYAIWSTIPRVIIDEYHEEIRKEGFAEFLRGKTVEFEATVTRSDRDESFGFAKRPSKARLI